MLTRRAMLAGAALAATGGEAHAQARGFDAVVGDVRARGARRFTRITDAIDAAPATRPYRILIGPGRWREKLVIEKANIHLSGADRAQSVVSFDAAAGMARPDGQAWGTWGAASVIVRAADFSADNLTFENAFDYIADLASPQFERIGSNGAQAPALMLGAGADRSLFTRCDIVGHQDTLFVDHGRALLLDCRVSGSVDFIFGGAQAYFDRCELVSRFRPLMQRNHGWVAVPSTAASQEFGLIFSNCRLTREANVPPASVALGRAWRPARSFPNGRYGDPDAIGMAAFVNCWMDDHISADGWDEMGYAARDGARIFLQPGEARLAEFGSTGPGAFVNRRRPQLSFETYQRFDLARVLGDWRPDLRKGQ